MANAKAACHRNTKTQTYVNKLRDSDAEYTCMYWFLSFLSATQAPRLFNLAFAGLMVPSRDEETVIISRVIEPLSIPIFSRHTTVEQINCIIYT